MQTVATDVFKVPEGAMVYTADGIPLGALRHCGKDALLLQRGRLATTYWYLPSWSLASVDEQGVHLKLTKRAAEALHQPEWPPPTPYVWYRPQLPGATATAAQPAMA